MRRTVKLIAIVAVLVAAASFSAWAQSGKPSLPGVSPGETYLRADIWRNITAEAVRLPQVEGAQSGSGGPAISQGIGTAVMNSKGADAISSGGAALPGATFGAAFLTPTERAGNEIRKAIRKLA